MPTLFSETHRFRLEKKLQVLTKQPPQTPITLKLDSRRYVIKFSRRESGRFWRESLSALSCRLLFGLAIKPSAFRTEDNQYEAQRLQTLHSHNLAVPTLLLTQPNYIVMDYCGQSIEPLLKDPQSLHYLAPRIVNSLVELHESNQWHGGAQVRNLTLKQDVLFRIDFEERVGDILPLELAQAYDVLLCFNSLAKYLDYDVKLGEQLLRQYLQQRQNPELQHALQQILNHLLRLIHTTKPLHVLLRHRSDIQRTCYFATILQRSLQNS